MCEGNFLTPFKPLYTDHTPLPVVITATEYEDLPYIGKQKYRHIGPGKTWEQVTDMDIDHFINELKGLKDEYEEGTFEIKNEITKKVRKIFELCKKYTDHSDSRANQKKN